MQNLSERHPFLTAREAFLAGRIHSAQAIGMAAKDREFIAESELKGMAPLDAARQVVAGPWMRRRIEALANDRRAAALGRLIDDDPFKPFHPLNHAK